MKVVKLASSWLTFSINVMIINITLHYITLHYINFEGSAVTGASYSSRSCYIFNFLEFQIPDNLHSKLFPHFLLCQEPRTIVRRKNFLRKEKLCIFFPGQEKRRDEKLSIEFFQRNAFDLQ